MRWGAAALTAICAAGCGASATSEPSASEARAGAPEELADARALRELADWTALPVLQPPRGVRMQQTSAQRDGASFDEIALLARGNRDMNNFVCGSEDARARFTGLVRATYDLPTCPEPWTQGLVLSRFEGSGQLVRLQLTAISLSEGHPTGEERLRVWIDAAVQPQIDVPLAAALDGTAGEMFASPFGTEDRANLAWRYPLVFAERLVIAIDGFSPLDLVYHQTTVRTDHERRTAATSRLPERDAAKALLSRTRSGPVETRAALAPPTTLTVPPAGTAVVPTIPGPATIHALVVRAQRAALPTLANVRLRARWDDDLAIDVPLLDLFAATHDVPDVTSLALAGRMEGDDVVLELRLPMPFRRAAAIDLVNDGAEAVSLTIAAEGERRVPDATFGVLAVEAHAMRAPITATSVPLVTAKGRGRFVGVCLTLAGHGLPKETFLGAPLNFLEGDETYVVDGTALRGTGTEDYLDSSFYFGRGAYGRPFAQAWGIVRGDASSPRGRVSACRWHVLTDVVDFVESLDASLEIGPGRPDLLEEYRSVAFVYR